MAPRAQRPTATRSRKATGAAGAAKPSSTAASADRPSQKIEIYFAALPKATYQRMRQLRALIRSASPEAVEWFSYGIPGYRLFDKPFVWYGAFTEHVSLFPMTLAIRTAFAKELDGYETSKGTVRFPHDRPLPAALITRLVKARATEVRAGG
jgi:uncharacterized protein YdhG (YjbR/CyaY superfamily)